MTNNLSRGDSNTFLGRYGQPEVAGLFGFSPPTQLLLHNRSSLQRGWRYGHGLNKKAEGTGEQ